MTFWNNTAPGWRRVSADLLRMANQYLHKGEPKILVVGNASGFDKQTGSAGDGPAESRSARLCLMLPGTVKPAELIGVIVLTL